MQFHVEQCLQHGSDNMLVVSGYDINDDVIFEERFDGQAFYETILANIADKYDLGDKMPLEYYENSTKGLQMRNSRILPQAVKDEITKLNLAFPEDELIEVVMANEKHFTGEGIIKYILRGFLSLGYGNLEDIRSFLEEQNIKKTYKVIFKRV